MVDSQACPHMAILSENRHISSFIGHVPHANSPFSFQGRHRTRRTSLDLSSNFCHFGFEILAS